MTHLIEAFTAGILVCFAAFVIVIAMIGRESNEPRKPPNPRSILDERLRLEAMQRIRRIHEDDGA